MRLTRLELDQFRSFEHLALDVPTAGLRLRGANASGKSTFVEAIMMLASTRSFRTGSERETIRQGSGADLGVPPFARIRGVVDRSHDALEIELSLEADAHRAGQLKKMIRLNGRSVRAVDAVGQLKAVLFSPEDVSLVSGPPAMRRRYLDLTISQVDSRYLRALSRFGKVLTQRNSLLKTFQKDGRDPRSAAVAEQLGFWDEELLAHGSFIVATRGRILRRLAELAARHYSRLAIGRLAVSYLPALAEAPRFEVDDAPERSLAAVRQAYVHDLTERRFEELRRGMTLVGPHRDDLQFLGDGLDLGIYGSRGQQRLAVVALKLAEIELMTEVAGEAPVLLLDDVLSELDFSHRRQLEQTTAAIDAQAIITGTDATEWSAAASATIPAMLLVAGSIVADDSGPGQAGR